MKKISTFFLLGLAVSIVSSCSVEKRVHNPGYHISWKKSAGQGEKQELSASENAKPVKSKSAQLNEEAAAVSQAETAIAVPEIDNGQQTASANVSVIRQEVKTILTNPAESQEAAKSMYQSKVKTTVARAAIRKAVKKSQPSNAADDDLILLYILCFIVPFVAVGIVTDWELQPLLISILLSLLCWIPGIIYAIVIVGRNR